MLRVLFERPLSRYDFCFISNIEAIPFYISRAKIESIVVCRSTSELLDFIAEPHSFKFKDNCKKSKDIITITMGCVGHRPTHPIYLLGEGSNKYNILHPQDEEKIKKLLD